MNKRIKISIWLTLLLVISGAVLSAAEKTENAEKKERKPRSEMSASELADTIKDMVDSEDEILNFVPGLQAVKGEDDVLYYAYEGVPLEKLEKDRLQKIFSRVANERTRIRTDKLNRQLDSIRQAQQAARMQTMTRAPQVPQQIPQVPRTPNPPPPQPPQTRR